MSSYTRQCVPLYYVKCRVTLDSAFRCTSSYVELSSTVRSAVLGPMSSCSRQCVPLYWAQCRVTLDSAFRCTKSNVESHSTVRSAVPSPVSRYTYLCFLRYHIKQQLVSSDVHEIRIFSDRFSKNYRIQIFMKIIHWVSSFCMRTEGRTDGQTVTMKLIVTFRNLLTLLETNSNINCRYLLIILKYYRQRSIIIDKNRLRM